MKDSRTELVTIVHPERIVTMQGIVENPDIILQKRPPIATFERAPFTKLIKTGEENPYVVLDFGKELHGSLRPVVARLNKKKHVRVRLVFGESVSEALASVGSDTSTNDHSPRDFETILSSFSNVDYALTGFRFVRIELLEEAELALKCVVAVSKTSPAEQKGYLRTDNERLNKILDVATYTCFLNLQQGVIWDGIKRDRLVWAGDLNTEILTLMYMYGSVENIPNSLDVLRDNTTADEWMNDIPSYSVWWVLNHFDYYRLGGDLEYLLSGMERINHILKNLDLCVNDDGTSDFARTGGAGHMPYFLDWPTRGTNDEVVGTMLLIYLMAKKICETPVDGVDLDAARSLIRKLERFLDAPTLMKQTLAMQEFCGGRAADAKARLEEGGAKGFSTFMSYFLLKGLDVAGSREALRLAIEYYGAMLDRGATTFWEDFDMNWLEGSGRIDEIPAPGMKDLHADYGKYCYKGLRHSFCHGWSSGVVSWAVEDLLGLKVLAPGYSKISLSPNLEAVGMIDACIPTPNGNLYVKAERGQELQITLPEGVELV